MGTVCNSNIQIIYNVRVMWSWTFTLPFIFRKGYEQRQTAACDKASPLFASFSFLPPSLKVFVFPHLPPPSLLYKHIWLLTSMWLSTESYWVTRPQQKHVPQWELSSVMMVVTCDCEPMKRGTQWKRNTNKTFSGIHVFVFNSLNFIKWTCGSMYVTKCGLALYVTAIVVTQF